MKQLKPYMTHLSMFMRDVYHGKVIVRGSYSESYMQRYDIRTVLLVDRVELRRQLLAMF